MSSTKVAESFFELTGNTLQNTSMLKLFNILLDEDRKTEFMNIFKTLRVNPNIKTDIYAFDTYEVEGDNQAFWDNISFDLYGTPFLWWIVAIFNDVVNPFEELSPGSNLSVLKADYLYNIFKDIDTLSEL